MEEIIKRKPIVTKDCFACGACISISPDVFEFNKEGLSQAKELDDYEGKNVDDCIAVCPAGAIKWKS